MRPCPNCGRDVAADSDRFCPHCGYLLPTAPVDTGNEASTQPTPVAPQAAASAPPPVQPAYQPSSAPAPPPVYTAPDPTGYSAPSYTSGGNLPSTRVQHAPVPVAPARGADPTMNTLMKIVRSVVALDTRGLLILAAVVVVAIIAVVLVAKAVLWLLSILPWLLLIAAIVYLGQRRRRRRRRLP